MKVVKKVYKSGKPVELTMVEDKEIKKDRSSTKPDKVKDK